MLRRSTCFLVYAHCGVLAKLDGTHATHQHNRDNTCIMQGHVGEVLV